MGGHLIRERCVVMGGTLDKRKVFCDGRDVMIGGLQ
jgi:hypothetical protein